MNTLTASDGHQLAYYQANPAQTPRGGVLVIQEIFGVNAHIRSICDTYASHGYSALAPALFDRVERGIELGYDDEGTRRGLALINQLNVGDVLKDLQAGVDALAAFGRVGVVGICWGGSWTWTAAGKLSKLAAASSYYGAAIPRTIDSAPLDSAPRTPIILHLGEHDAMMPMSNIDRVRKAHPDVPIYMYPSGHHFNCDVRDGYHAESAKLALQRTLDFFGKHVG